MRGRATRTARAACQPAGAGPRGRLPQPRARSGAYAAAVTIRCTQRLLKAMRIRPRQLADVPVSEDDWYANLLWFNRRKCLLLTHAGTLFSVCVQGIRQPDLRPIALYVVEVVDPRAPRS